MLFYISPSNLMRHSCSLIPSLTGKNNLNKSTENQMPKLPQHAAASFRSNCWKVVEVLLIKYMQQLIFIFWNRNRLLAQLKNTISPVLMLYFIYRRCSSLINSDWKCNCWDCLQAVTQISHQHELTEVSHTHRVNKHSRSHICYCL